MSFAALNTALTGLRAAQQQLSVISNNVSNVSSPGYTRKILPQASQVIEGTGQTIGVTTSAVIRNVNLNLERELWTQVSATQFFDIQANYLEKIQRFHGPPDKEFSIAAEIADLRDTFSVLSDAPDDVILLDNTLNQGLAVASKFNDFGALITELRNDAQDDIERAIVEVNDLLTQIANANRSIRVGSANIGRSTAALEDERDKAINELSELLEITFFQRGDGVLVVQTSTGVQLADENAAEVFFNPTNIGATTYYPDSINGIFVGGDPASNVTSIDITTSGIGGEIGALVELRDETLLEYQAQIDELAHKVALRFDAQGLRLFTDAAGTIPPDTPPDLTPLPAGTPARAVEYVGFASVIQVNEAVLADITLLQQGTYTPDVPIPTGSNEVIRRVLEFTFDDINYQEAAGTTDLRVAVPATDLQEWLGLLSQNNIVGGPDLTQFSEIDSAGLDPNDLITTIQTNFLPNFPADDEFRIQLFDRADVATPVTIDVDLSVLGADPTFAIGAVDPSGTLADGTIDNALDQLVSFINDTIITEEGLGNIPTNINARAGINPNGQFTFFSHGDVEFLADGFVNGMTSTGFQSVFGFSPQLFATEDPYFDVQIGNKDPVRITIEPGDTEVELEDKLDFAGAVTGVPGLSVVLDGATGFLTLRPGNDVTPEDFGGDMKLIGGPFTTNAAINPALAALPSGVNVISALFGSFAVSGLTVTEASPVVSVSYQSETEEVAGVGSGVFVSFRNELLGPNVSTNTRILNVSNILTYAQKMVGKQSEDFHQTELQRDDESTLHDLVQREFLNESGVNLEEELSNLIVTQTAFAAAAKAVSAADQMLQELLEAVR